MYGSEDVSEAVNIVLVTLSVCVYTLLRTALSEIFTGSRFTGRFTGRFTSHIVRYLIDYVTLVVPLLVVYTVGHEHHLLLNSALLGLCVLGLHCKLNLLNRSQYPSLNADYPYSTHKTYISCFRSYVTLSTVICILAYDFRHIFPRKYGKTEHYGYSLMDTGVGSFMYMAGLVAPEARTSSSSSKTFKKTILSSLVLIVIGVLRTVLLNYTNYSYSTHEYGRDWNFFISLGVVKISSSVLLSLCPVLLHYSGLCSAVIALSYQIALEKFNLEGLLEDGFSDHFQHDNGFVNANREGIFSSVGMLAIYFNGLATGLYIFKTREKLREQLQLLAGLVGVAGLMWISVFLLDLRIAKASRCFGNLTYVCWTIAQNLSLVAGLFLAELLFFVLSRLKTSSSPSSSSSSSSTTTTTVLHTDQTLLIPGGCAVCFKKRSTENTCSCLVSAIGRNQLLYFLLGNVLTGLVNFLVDTRSTTQHRSLGMMNVYLLAVNGIVTVFAVRRWTIKFW